jgi:hypothetical protein
MQYVLYNSGRIDSGVIQNGRDFVSTDCKQSWEEIMRIKEDVEKKKDPRVKIEIS